jgi:hypothetical protein
MSDISVADAVEGDEAVKRTRHKAELVEIDFDDIPGLTRQGRSSALKERVAKVKDDNTGKPRLIAKYQSAASASSAATAQRKAFAGQGYKFAVRAVDEATGLFVLWNEEWVGADDAPKSRRKAKVETAVDTSEATAENVANAEANTAARRGRR